MTGQPAAGGNSITIKGSGGLIWNKSVRVSPESIEIFKKPEEVERRCPLDKAKLVSTEYWEARAGLAGPTTTRKLILELRDGSGNLLFNSEGTSRCYVNDFTIDDVKRLAEAIAQVRPGILLVSRCLLDMEAKSLMSPPSGSWNCPHCKAANSFSEPLWRLKQASAARASILGMPPEGNVVCPQCKSPVNVASLAPRASGCFIATAALGSSSSPQLLVLEQFRDRYLHTFRLGRWFIAAYYKASPPIAAIISRHPRLRVLVRDWLVLPSAALVSNLKQIGAFSLRRRVSRTHRPPRS